MKDKIIQVLYTKLKEVEEEIVFTELEFYYWNSKRKLIQEIINEVNNIEEDN